MQLIEANNKWDDHNRDSTAKTGHKNDGISRFYHTLTPFPHHYLTQVDLEKIRPKRPTKLFAETNQDWINPGSKWLRAETTRDCLKDILPKTHFV